MEKISKITYYSTNLNAPEVDFPTALLKGLAPPRQGALHAKNHSCHGHGKDKVNERDDLPVNSKSCCRKISL